MRSDLRRCRECGERHPGNPVGAHARACRWNFEVGASARCDELFHAHATYLAGVKNPVPVCAQCLEHPRFMRLVKRRTWWRVTTVHRVVSGGQTGADRGGLAAAAHLGVEFGGWCPAGARAVDGEIPTRFWRCMQETRSHGYEERTRLNVRDSDATLVVTLAALTPGSRATIALAREMTRPVLHVELGPGGPGASHVDLVRAWLHEHAPGVLNVAGSRETADNRLMARTANLVARALSCPTCARAECRCPCPGGCGENNPRKCTCATIEDDDRRGPVWPDDWPDPPRLPFPEDWVWSGAPVQLELF